MMPNAGLFSVNIKENEMYDLPEYITHNIVLFTYEYSDNIIIFRL